jgi:hypothetical protein
MYRTNKPKKTNKISKLLLIATAITATAFGAANGYSDIKHMNRVEGIGTTAATVDTFPVADITPETPPVANVTPVTVGGNKKPSKTPAKPKLHTKVITKTKLPSSVHIHAPKPIAPAVPDPPSAIPQLNCFVAETEGIYIPRGGNVGSFTFTADKPVYWRTLSPAIATTDEGIDVPTNFWAYIVLESSYDPNVAATSISFHIHSRSTAPLGEYCPPTFAEQIGVGGYNSPGPEDKKLFDIPLNINIVEKL